MDRVVRRSWVVRVVGEEPESDRAGPDLQSHAQVTCGGDRAQNRECVEGGHLGVVRILSVESLHRLHISDAASDVFALAPQHLDSAKETLLALGRRLGHALGLGRSQALKHAPWLIRVHLRDQRMVVRKRLAPIRHGEIRIERLRLLELLDRLVPAEAVKNRDGAKKMLLDISGRRRWEVEGAHGVELRVDRDDHRRDKTHRQDYTTHRFHCLLL